MKKSITLLATALFFATMAAAQGFAINTDGSSAHVNALLDVKSTTKGILIPRMSKTQKNAIGSPATGLLVFQDTPDSIGFYYYSGSSWLWLTHADYTDTLVWKRSGNAATTPASHFVGTTDNRPLRLRINNIWAGELDSSKRSVLLGLGAGQNTNSGSRANIAIGNASQRNNSSGSGNITIGDSALYTATTLTSNTIAIGNKALYKNTNGLFNTAIGDSVLYNNSTGLKNTAVGYGSLRTNFGSYNTALGYRSLYLNTNGFENTAIGHAAGYSNTTSFRQVAIGDSALYSNTGGGNNDNTAVGVMAGAYNPGSSDCIYIGFRSGWKSSGGASNIFLGNYAGENNTGDLNMGVGPQALRYNNAGNNIAVGFAALEINTSGFQNTSIGSSTLRNDTAGYQNTAVGYSSMWSHRRNNYNTAVGVSSLRADTAGTQNTAVGSYAMNHFYGDRNTSLGANTLNFGSGDNNTAIGANADVGSNNVDFATAIGAGAICDTSNSMVLGQVNVTNVGVGITKPLSRMDVNGSIGSGIRTITINTTATVTDHTIIISNTVGLGAVAITLPAAASVNRREYRIVNRNLNINKSITTYTDFSGAAVTTLPSNDAIVVQSNGTGWVRVL